MLTATKTCSYNFKGEHPLIAKLRMIGWAVANYVNLWFSNGLDLDISSFAYIMWVDGSMCDNGRLSSYRNIVLGYWRKYLGANATEEVRSGITSEGLSESLPTDNESTKRIIFDSWVLALVRCGCGSVSGTGKSGYNNAPMNILSRYLNPPKCPLAYVV